MLKSSDKYVTYSQLTRLWSTRFSNVVIPRKVRMGYCSICANLNSSTKGAETPKEKDINKSLLQDHREAQALERKKVMHHREKSLKKSEHYLCLMLDVSTSPQASAERSQRRMSFSNALGGLFGL